jgi:hypothetical protein
LISFPVRRQFFLFSFFLFFLSDFPFFYFFR